MKRLLGSAALALAVLVMVSSVAMAWDFTDHVKIAPNKKGDVLIFPVYVALNGGWETKFTVINTAADRSVVAKVVFRSMYFSQELLDFIIYLTPTDVATFVVRFNASTSRVECWSDDDSVLSSGTTWANTAAFTANLTIPTCTLGSTADMANIGYVEVIESAHSVGAATAVYPPATGQTAVNLNQPPVNKNALRAAYDDWAYGRVPVANIKDIVLTNEGINVLTGVEEFRNTSLNQKAALEATVLRDYDATKTDTLGTYNKLLTPQQETFFGETAAFNSIGELEAALAKNDLAMYYSNQNLTLHFFTFPTKESFPYTTNRTATTGCTIAANTLTSPYFHPTTGCIQYNGVTYDRSENPSTVSVIVSPATQAANMCAEVNWVGNFAFTEGWSRYTFTTPSTGGLTVFDVKSAVAPYNAGNDGDYTGAPVIGTVLNLNQSDDGYVMVGAASTSGLVRDLVSPAGTAYALTSVNPTNYYYYQFQDERNMGTNYDADLPLAPFTVEDQSRAVGDGHHPRN